MPTQLNKDSSISVLDSQLTQLCTNAVNEQFEAGMESQFSISLQQLCNYKPPDMIALLKVKLMDENTNPEVLAEIVRWASRQESIGVRDDVFDFLISSLDHSSSLVRDAGALGLASFDEIAVYEPLKKAARKEKIPELKKDLQNLVCSLNI